jgi:hypothetical protein
VNKGAGDVQPAAAAAALTLADHATLGPRAVLIPVKSFALAKRRLDPALGE